QQTEAIILAGGLGTRLRSAVPDLPKCMAPVAGRPFLYYVINHLRMQGISRLIFSLGYMHEAILNWLQAEYPTLDYECVIEDEHVGTVGEIQCPLEKTKTENIFIGNGDTLIRYDPPKMLHQHLSSNAECTLGLKPMLQCDRYELLALAGD